MQPLLEHPPDARPYPRGSWAPDDAESLVRGYRAGSRRGYPRGPSPRIGGGVQLDVRLEGVGRLAHGLAGLQHRAEGAA